jgi:hypothetical protein
MSSDLKLSTSLIGSKTCHLYACILMEHAHCPCIICTHNTPYVNCTLSKVRAKFDAQILHQCLVSCLWGRGHKGFPHPLDFNF